MAKASAQITLTYVIDVKATYRYYLLQSSTLSAPSKPTTFPPSSEWDDTEPAYEEGSTNSLYFVDCTVFCDDSFSYSEVSLSSSYEAAKQAYNKAQNAQDTADNAQTAADEAAKVATNYMNFSDAGLVVGDMVSDILGQNILIDADSVDIRDGDTVLARYGSNNIYLGMNNKHAVIDLANGVGQMYNESDTTEYNRLVIESPDSISLKTDHVIDQSVIYPHTNMSEESLYSYAGCKMLTNSPWDLPGDEGYIPHPSINMRVSQITTGDTSLHEQCIDGDAIIEFEPGHAVFSASYYDDNTTSAISITGSTITISAYDTIMLALDDVADEVRPYYKKGDSISLSWYGAGYITSSKTTIHFSVPLSRPIIGSPKVTVTSGTGLTLRQDGSYTHGSSSSVAVFPSSYSALANSGNHVRITATMSNTTNAINNSSIGINANIIITFS